MSKNKIPKHPLYLNSNLKLKKYFFEKNSCFNSCYSD